MYGKKGLDSFYRLDKVGCNDIDDRVSDGFVRFEKSLNNCSLNDNDIVRIVYGIGNRLNVLPNDMDVVNNPSYPMEVRNVLNSIQQRYPSFPGFPADSDDVFDFIRDRAVQFGGELDDFVETMADEISRSSQQKTE